MTRPHSSSNTRDRRNARRKCFVSLSLGESAKLGNWRVERPPLVMIVRTILLSVGCCCCKPVLDVSFRGARDLGPIWVRLAGSKSC